MRYTSLIKQINRELSKASAGSCAFKVYDSPDEYYLAHSFISKSGNDCDEDNAISFNVIFPFVDDEEETI